ncbi:YifB family Mg chelatase-like AAA ATPase [Austwickia chelonae]|uniref:YifB family Mg chelatase-like AAA ATPase n=1 Tax=Austwickia chelonae TaxID=100225 RepID=UPI000E23670B|nr:YifB family Mg chelatase-like AAA ATPase [Austwickia chelonae]
MTLGRTRGTVLDGLEGALVQAEADVGNGLPTFLIVGLPDAACRQATDRIRAAAANSGLDLPTRKIVVNLSPASLPKSGSGLDLAIAVAALSAAGKLPLAQVSDVLHLGELGLDGTVRPVHGVLPLVLAAAQAGIDAAVVPAANAAEARLVPGITIWPVHTLSQLAALHDARRRGHPIPEHPDPAEALGATAAVKSPLQEKHPDLADVIGQEDTRFALEVAAAGGHHMFMLGPPGSGKTMLAERLPSILPLLAQDQALESTAIHSVLGTLPSGVLVRHAPFVAPHHGASMSAMIGGGSGAVRPGLISQAHHGVLFLDEAPEFRPHVLQSLRQPLESGTVVVARSRSSVRYPARFQLVLAANPCPCGRGHGKGRDCTCTPRARRDYLGRLAGPLLDRVDLQVQVPAVSIAMLGNARGEDSATVAERVSAARKIQRARYGGQPWSLNAQVPGCELRHGPHAVPPTARTDLDRALERGQLTLRGYDRVLRLSQTVRDLAGGGTPNRADIGIALTLRAQAGAHG